MPNCSTLPIKWVIHIIFEWFFLHMLANGTLCPVVPKSTFIYYTKISFTTNGSYPSLVRHRWLAIIQPTIKLDHGIMHVVSNQRTTKRCYHVQDTYCIHVFCLCMPMFSAMLMVHCFSIVDCDCADCNTCACEDCTKSPPYPGRWHTNHKSPSFYLCTVEIFVVYMCRVLCLLCNPSSLATPTWLLCRH
jgi:hypothetical protein